jgi:hypothetical protein
MPETSISVRKYLVHLAATIEEAGDAGDVDEAIRLWRLLSDIGRQQAEKLELERLAAPKPTT